MDVNGIIDRAKEALNLEQDQELAVRLNVSRSAIAAWRRRGSIPAKYLSEMMIKGTVSLDWLLTGNGDRLSANQDGWATYNQDDNKPFAEKEVIWLSLLLIRRELISSSRDDEALLGRTLSDDLLANMHILMVNYMRRVSRSRRKWTASGIVRADHIYNALVAEYGFGQFENPPPPWWEPDNLPDE